MDKHRYLHMAEMVSSGHTLGPEALGALAELPQERALDLLPGADMIREAFFGKGIHLCNILNAKSGKCSEDCAFCAQSAFAKTDAPVYALKSKQALQDGALAAKKAGIHRYSFVTSGKRLPPKEVAAIAGAVRDLDRDGPGYCVSLGILEREDFEVLREAGITRIHHNLETSESFFPRICTTHTYRERLESIRAAKAAGLSLCVGGLFGMGETDAQVLELALAIRDLDVDSVPINFLSPIRGTRMEDCRTLTPLRCLKIISLFRYALPDKDILVCGGREKNLKELHPLIFYAGASGIMTGNYLTTRGRTLDRDLRMLRDLGLFMRETGPKGASGR